MAPFNVDRRELMGQSGWRECDALGLPSNRYIALFFTSRARTTLKGALQCMVRFFVRVEVYLAKRDSGTNVFHGVG